MNPQQQHRGKKEKDKHKEEETDKQRKADEERERVDSYSSHIVLTLWAIYQTEHIRKTNDLTGAVDSDNKAYNDYRWCLHNGSLGQHQGSKQGRSGPGQGRKWAASGQIDGRPP